MKIRSITLHITDDCNFDCTYCYAKKNKDYMKYSTVEKALAFFLPKLPQSYFLSFYGGEPLLSFNLIKRIISFLNKKNNELKKRVKYSITTNGSLLTKEVIRFLARHKFSVELSFDGLAQDIQRKKGSFKKIVSSIKELLKHPNIDLEVNSVFTPETVDYLSGSMKFIMNLGVPSVHFSLSLLLPWEQDALGRLKKEMTELRTICRKHFEERGHIPVANFRDDLGKGVSLCPAGKDRLTITPKEKIWGCYLFYDYFKEKGNSPEYYNYYFGTLDHFMENYENIYPIIASNYSQLSMDKFSTPHMECFLCSDLEYCEGCPINAAFSGYPLGKIPAFVCNTRKIMIREKEVFRKEIGAISGKTT